MSDLWTNTQWETTLYAVFSSTISPFFQLHFYSEYSIFHNSNVSVCVCERESERKGKRGKEDIFRRNSRFSSSIFTCCFCTLFDSCTALDSTLRTTLPLFFFSQRCCVFLSHYLTANSWIYEKKVDALTILSAIKPLKIKQMVKKAHAMHLRVPRFQEKERSKKKMWITRNGHGNCCSGYDKMSIRFFFSVVVVSCNIFTSI